MAPTQASDRFELTTETSLDRLAPRWPGLPDGVRDCWYVASEWVRIICNGFGEPSALADQRVMQRRKWREICDLLRGAETMVRHVLLILALWAPHTPILETKSRRKLNNGGAGGGSGGFSATFIDPQYWRLRFALPALPNSKDNSAPVPAYEKITFKPQQLRGGRRKFSDFVDTLSCAERLEKLRRVLENPEPYAARLRNRMLPRAVAPETDHQAQNRTARRTVERLMKRPQRAFDQLERTLGWVIPCASQLSRRFYDTG